VPANTGERPSHARVDIRFRNGTIARGVDPSKYRWTINDPKYPPDTAGEIRSWQPS
jgi:hypothetical protein